MAYLKLLLVLTSTLFLGCSNQSSTNSVANAVSKFSGKIIGYQGNDVFISLPIAGSGYAGFSEKIAVQPDGTFLVDINLNKASLVTLLMPRVFKRIIIVEPNKTYNFEIDARSINSAFNFLDESKPIQDLYGSFENPDYIARNLPSLNSSMTNKDYHAMFDATFNKETNALAKLKENVKISDEVTSLITADRKCYKAARKSELAWRITRMKSVVDDNLKSYWKEIFNEVKPSNDLMSSSWFPTYASSFARYSKINDANFNLTSHKNTEKTESRINLFVNAFSKNLNKEMSEMATATYLHKESTNGKNEKACIDMFSSFKSNYKKSPFLKMLQPNIDAIEKYYKVIDADFAEGINFIKSPERINSLADLANQFKGQKIYIDVWATWCGPCRREFSYNEGLKPMLKENDVKPIYISTDKPKDLEKWKRFIKQYDLKGYHINASNNLKYDIQTHYGGGLRIPYYLLIDSKGKVAVNHAARPSQLGKLTSQVLSMN